MRYMVNVLLLVCVLMIPRGLMSREWVEIELGASLLIPEDRESKRLYGDRAVLPELTLALRPLSFFSLVGMVSIQNGKATLSDINEQITHREINFYFGGRFVVKLGEKLAWRAEGGGLVVNYREEAFNGEVDGSALGFYAATGFSYRLFKPLFITVNVIYTQAEETVKDKAITFGGIGGSIRLGVAF